MRVRLDIETGEMAHRQVPQVPIAQIYVLTDFDTFSKRYGFVLDNPNGHPYAISHRDEGCNEFWSGVVTDWLPEEGITRVVDEWVISDLYTGVPLYLCKSGGMIVPHGVYSGAYTVEEQEAYWQAVRYTCAVEAEDVPDLREFLLEYEGPQYVEEYYTKNGVDRMGIDYWYAGGKTPLKVPCRYKGRYQVIEANVNVVNGRAFAIPYDPDVDFENDPFDLIDLSTGEVSATYLTYAELVTRGMIDAVTLSRRYPLLEGLIPVDVPREYLEYLDEIGKDYWALAKRGLPAMKVK